MTPKPRVHFIRKWNRSGGGGCPALYVTDQTVMPPASTVEPNPRR